MKFPKPKKSKRKFHQKEADHLFSLLVRSRGVCQAKGLDTIKCSGRLQTCHIVGRGNKRLRFSEENALCMCSAHHFYYTYHPSVWFWVFIPEHFSKQFWFVRRHQNEFVKNNSNRLKEVILALESKLDTLGIEH